MARKNQKNLRKNFNACGVYVFVMTPMKHILNRQGKCEVDLEGVEKNIRYFSKIKGEKTMVLCGGSGEFYSLTPSEVRDIGAAAVAGAEGRCKIVSGIGGTTKTAVKMAENAQEAGCDAVLVMPHDPIVARGEKTIWQHHQAINRAIDIGFLPFRAPRQLISKDLVKRFADLDRVVAIKEESNAIDWVRSGCLTTGNSVPFITGGGENMVPYYYLA
ncbi:MAG: dihydrodipicolinate synthase family protein, partial [bacterium]|nr:dihydrodipicolinate synthase family protein [bacterium]